MLIEEGSEWVASLLYQGISCNPDELLAYSTCAPTRYLQMNVLRSEPPWSSVQLSGLSDGE